MSVTLDQNSGCPVTLGLLPASGEKQNLKELPKTTFPAHPWAQGMGLPVLPCDCVGAV